jgi:hypothetical protein
MYEAHMKMRPKGDTEPWTMYGMVTTAVGRIPEGGFYREALHLCKMEWGCSKYLTMKMQLMLNIKTASDQFSNT